MEESSSSSSSSSSGDSSSEDSNSDVAEDLPPTPLLDTPLSLENLQSYLGRIFTDSEDGHRYIINDLWFDDNTQDFVGSRVREDGIHGPDAEDVFLFDYFLRELAQTPVELAPSSFILDDEFRTDVRKSLEFWYGKGTLKPFEVSLIPDEHDVFHFYRRVYDNNTRSEHYQLIIPNGPRGEVIKKQLLHSCHEDCGHLRTGKMYDELWRRCWWPGMKGSVETHVKSCISCQIRGTTRDRQERQTRILETPRVYRPFQRVALDILKLGSDRSKGRATSSTDSADPPFCYLVVAVDHFTKYVEAEGFVSAPSAMDVNDFMMRHFFLRHGSPEVVVADNGANVTANQLNSELLQAMGTQSRHVTTYHAAANGQVERFNKVICDFLVHHLDDYDHYKWGQYLAATLFAINTSVNTTTGFTPFFLVHGREARRIIDRMLPDWGGTRWRRKSWQDYADSVQEVLRVCNEVAGLNISKAHSMYNQPRVIHRLQSSLIPLAAPSFSPLSESVPPPHLGRRITKRFLPGDQVLVYVPVVKTSKKRRLIKKLTKFWRGPFEVIRSINDVTYLLRIDQREQAFHINRLKPYFSRDWDGTLAFF